jgi:cytochrome P450
VEALVVAGRKSKAGATVDVIGQLTAPSVVADPYPYYAALRARAEPPCTPAGEVVFSRYVDVAAVLGHSRFGKPQAPWLPSRALRTLGRMFLLIDPPDHTRLRRAVAPKFTTTGVAARQERTAAIAARLLETATAHSNTIEVMSAFAYPFPLTVISELLGVEPADRPKVAAWSQTLTAELDAPMPVDAAHVWPAAKALIARRSHPLKMVRAATGIVSYATRRLAQAATDGVVDEAEVLATLVAAHHQGVLSMDEAAATWVLLVIAGHETTANLLGNSLHALLAHPDQCEAVQGDPTLLPAAVDECLRYDSPVPYSARVALEDLEVGGVGFRKGQWAIVLIGSANRDDAAFPKASRLDITRPPQPSHLAFGHGLHFCLGAALARQEAEIGLAQLLDCRPHPTGPAHWRPLLAVRGLQHLPIAFAKAGP